MMTHRPKVYRQGSRPGDRGKTQHGKSGYHGSRNWALRMSLSYSPRTGAEQPLTPDRTQETQVQAHPRVGPASLHFRELLPQHSPWEGPRQTHCGVSAEKRRPRWVLGGPASCAGCWGTFAAAGPAKQQRAWLEGLISGSRSL